jgi:hypothetical protein
MLLYRFGALGLLSHLGWVFFWVIWLLRRLNKSTPLTKSIIASAIGIILVMSIAGLTNAVFTYSGAVEYLWILLAMVIKNEDNKV